MKIAIVGGIGSGKSTVAKNLENFMRDHVFYSVDDAVRTIYDHEAVINMFAPLGLTTKEQMSDVVFSNPFIKKKLEDVSAPIIGSIIDKWLNFVNVVIEFPLLFQCPEYVSKFDVIVCVTADDAVRIERVMNRSGFTQEKVVSIIDAQIPQDVIADQSDVVFDNSQFGSAGLVTSVRDLVGVIKDRYREKQVQVARMSEPAISQASELMEKIRTRKPSPDSKIGAVSGSFDPISNGHIWLIDKALELVDFVHVVIATNASKSALFSDPEKVQMIKLSIHQMLGQDKAARCRVLILDPQELLITYCRDWGINHIFRGIRSGTDFDYEHQINLAQRKIDPSIEIIYLMPPRDITEISSSLVKSLYKLKGTDGVVSSYVPPAVFEALQKKIHESRLSSK